MITLSSSGNSKEERATRLIQKAWEIMEKAISEEICQDFFHGEASIRCDGKWIEVFHSLPRKNGEAREGLKSHWLRIESLSEFYFKCEGQQRLDGFNAIIKAFESEAARLRKHRDDKPEEATP